MEKCCICLDSDVRLRLKCCKSAWFHDICETQWIEFEEYPFLCPVCRQHVPMKTNYSLSYQAGPDQQLFWIAMCVIGTESTVFRIFPLTQLAIIAFPFVIRSGQFLPYFIKNALVLSGIRFFFYTTAATGINVAIIGYFQLFILIIMQLRDNSPRVDPLNPYAISREIDHLVAEPPPLPLKSRLRPRRH